jgi:hypothetical protein
MVGSAGLFFHCGMFSIYLVLLVPPAFLVSGPVCFWRPKRTTKRSSNVFLVALLKEEEGDEEKIFGLYPGRVPGHLILQLPNRVSETTKGRAPLSAFRDYAPTAWQKAKDNLQGNERASSITT